jgi:hypothetical protein
MLLINKKGRNKMTLNEHSALTAFKANKIKNKNLLNFAKTHGCTACQHFKLSADCWCYIFKHQRPIYGCGHFKTKEQRK